jgi:hypothetical protein
MKLQKKSMMGQILEAHTAEYFRLLAAYGTSYRDSDLLPVCERYTLTFNGGMGKHFYFEDGTPLELDDIERLEGIRNLMPTLEQEVCGGGHIFGMYVPDITKEDLETYRKQLAAESSWDGLTGDAIAEKLRVSRF